MSDSSYDKWHSRTSSLIGDENLSILRSKHVAIVGVGGVGGYAAEILARTGIGTLTIIDADDVATSNINRQLIATHSTIGESKVKLFADRFKQINPDIKVNALHSYLTPDNISSLLNTPLDFIIDAIDTVAPKIALIKYALNNNIPIISSMGAGGRIDPTKIKYDNIWNTHGDGLAKAVRQRLKKDAFYKKLNVVYSTETPQRHSLIELNDINKKSSLGTIASIPAIFGIFLANHVIRKITGI